MSRKVILDYQPITQHNNRQGKDSLAQYVVLMDVGEFFVSEIDAIQAAERLTANSVRPAVVAKIMGWASKGAVRLR